MEPVLYFNQIVCRLKLALEWSLPDQGHKGPLLNPGVHLQLAPEVELPHLLQLVEAMMKNVLVMYVMVMGWFS